MIYHNAPFCRMDFWANPHDLQTTWCKMMIYLLPFFFAICLVLFLASSLLSLFVFLFLFSSFVSFSLFSPLVGTNIKKIYDKKGEGFGCCGVLLAPHHLNLPKPEQPHHPPHKQTNQQQKQKGKVAEGPFRPHITLNFPKQKKN